MANLTSDYPYERASQELIPLYQELPGVAATTFYQGGLVYQDTADGKVKRIPAATSSSVAGGIEAIGWSGAISYTVPSSNDSLIPVHRGVWIPKLNSTAAAVSNTHLWKRVYAENDHTIRSNDGGGVYATAGILIGFTRDSKPRVLVGLPMEALDGEDIPPVRGVVWSNISDLTAFTVASDDGITYIEGDTFLAVGQTTAAQCGPWVVGAVAAGAAPLTRPWWWLTGTTFKAGAVVEVAEGGPHYGGSTWKATRTSAGVVGTNDPVFYPRQYTIAITLASGTYTIGLGSSATPDEPLFLYSATKSAISIARGPAGTPHSSTITYRAATITPGKAGTAVLTVRADVAAGTINASDASDLIVGVTNW